MPVTPRIVEMEAKSFTAGVGGRLVFQNLNLPSNANVLGFMFQLECTTSAAAGGNAARDVIGQLITGVTHRSDFFFSKFDGYGFDSLYHHMNGKALQGGASFVVGSGNRANMYIPISDSRCQNPSDQGVPAEAFRGTSFEIDISNVSTVTGAGNITLTGSQTLRHFAICEPRSGIIDPIKTRIEYEDWGGQTILLKRGAFTHLGLYKSSGADLTIAEVARYTLNFNGEPIFQNVQTEAGVFEYNRVNVAGGFQSNLIEQLPLTAFNFLPLYTPPDKYILSKVPTSQDLGDVTFQLSGSLTSPRVYYRIAEYKGESDYRNAWKAQGGQGEFTRSIKTLSKAPPPPPEVLAGDRELAAKWSKIARIAPGRLSK